MYKGIHEKLKSLLVYLVVGNHGPSLVAFSRAISQNSRRPFASLYAGLFYVLSQMSIHPLLPRSLGGVDGYRWQKPGNKKPANRG
ncbi:MAG: hypothetical protein ACI9EP_001753, partial [Oceanospirillaceae bacterium]